MSGLEEYQEFIDQNSDIFNECLETFFFYDNASKDIVINTLKNHPDWKVRINPLNSSLEVHDPNYMEGDSFFIGIDTDMSDLNDRVDDYINNGGTYTQTEGIYNPDKKKFDEVYREFIRRNNTDLDNAGIKVLTNEDGTVSIYSGDKLIIQSDEPIENYSEFMELANKSIGSVAVRQEEHNDLLFNSKNFDNVINYVDGDGKEHPVKLTPEEYQEYLKFGTEQEKVDYLWKKSHALIDTKESIGHKITLDFSDGDFIKELPGVSGTKLNELVLSDEEYNAMVRYTNNGQKYLSKYDIINYLKNKGYLASDYNSNNIKFEIISDNEFCDGINIQYGNGNKIANLNYSIDELKEKFNNMSKEELCDWLKNDRERVADFSNWNSDDFDISIEVIGEGSESKIVVTYIPKMAGVLPFQKTFSTADPDKYITEKLYDDYMKTQYQNDISLGDGTHTITFDDGRVIKLTEDEYQEYLKNPDILTRYDAYNESMITSYLNDKYNSSYDVKTAEIDGDKYYIVQDINGDIVAKIKVSDIVNDDKINVDLLYERVNPTLTDKIKVMIDGVEVEMTYEEYFAYLINSMDNVQDNTYASSLQTVFNNIYGDGTYVIIQKDGYLIVTKDGVEVKRALISDVITEDGISEEGFLSLLPDEEDGNKPRKKPYDLNSKFEFSKRLISFNDEKEYKNIVKKLNQSKESLSSVSTELGGVESQLSTFDDSQTQVVESSIEAINGMIEDADYLASAVDKTVNIYRVCDADLKGIFESSVVDEIFGRAGLFVWSGTSNMTGYGLRDEEYVNNRVDIRNNEGFLNVLNEIGDDIRNDLEKAKADWERWASEGFKVDEEMFKRLRGQYGENVVGITYTDFLRKLAKINNGKDTINVDVFSKLYTEAGLNINNLNEDTFLSLLRSNTLNPSDYDKYLALAGTSFSIEGFTGLNNAKAFLNNLEFFPLAVSDEYDRILEDIRNKGNNADENYWDMLAWELDLPLDEVKNMQPHHLAMLQMAKLADVVNSYEGDSNGHLTNEKDLLTVLRAINPDSNFSDDFNDMVFNYTSNDDWIDDFKGKLGLVKEHLNLDSLKNVNDLADKYRNTIIADDAAKRAGREAALKDLLNYAGDLGISLSSIAENFVGAMWNSVGGNVASVFDPNYVSMMDSVGYKNEYMLELVKQAQNMTDVELRYSRGEISGNQYEVLLKLANQGITDDLGNKISTVTELSKYFGKMAGDFLIKKLGSVEGLSGAIKLLKSLNEAGGNADNLRDMGISDVGVTGISLASVASSMFGSDLMKFLANKAFPSLPNIDKIGDTITDKLKQIVSGGIKLEDGSGELYDKFMDDVLNNFLGKLGKKLADPLKKITNVNDVLPGIIMWCLATDTENLDPNQRAALNELGGKKVTSPFINAGKSLSALTPSNVYSDLEKSLEEVLKKYAGVNGNDVKTLKELAKIVFG